MISGFGVSPSDARREAGLHGVGSVGMLHAAMVVTTLGGAHYGVQHLHDAVRRCVSFDAEQSEQPARQGARIELVAGGGDLFVVERLIDRIVPEALDDLVDPLGFAPVEGVDLCDQTVEVEGTPTEDIVDLTEADGLALGVRQVPGRTIGGKSLQERGAQLLGVVPLVAGSTLMALLVRAIIVSHLDRRRAVVGQYQLPRGQVVMQQHEVASQLAQERYHGAVGRLAGDLLERSETPLESC